MISDPKNYESYVDSDDDCQDSSTYEQFNGRQSPLRYQKRKMLVGTDPYGLRFSKC